MRNYLLTLLCFVTLFAVAMDVFMLHPRSVKAAASGTIRIQGVGSGPTRISGDVVGFSCSSGDCFIAIQEKP